QLAQALAGLALDAGLAKARHQLGRGTEEQHSVLPRRGLAVVQQHALGPIETTTAEQVEDRWVAGGYGGVQLRTQCIRRGTDHDRCGLGRAGVWSLITSSTGRSSCWAICAGC